MTDQRRAGGKGRSRRSGRRGSSPRRDSGRSSAPKAKGNITPLTPTLEPPDIESFAEFDLGEAIQSAIKGMGITKPTPIQALAIEPVLSGKDVIAKAETGTGKTLAFGAPMMSKIDPSRSTVLGLVLSPTRELAEQVHDVLKALGEASGVKTTLIVGGEDMGPQVRALQAGAQVVVGTPGRVLDLLNQKFLQFPWTEFAILDEADKMLEIGFIDDVKKILDACNEYRQTLLFSATFPPPLLELARGYTENPAEIATASGVSTVETIHQYFLRCGEEDRARELGHLIEDSADDDVFLVFCERRTDVDQLMRKLERRRFSVKALHGGYDQAARFRVMGAFRTGEVKCLVATDVASRGLDVKHVSHVVNLGVPRDVSDYTHRIGRTGRAGAHGVAVTFVSRRNERDWDNLRRQSGFDLTEIKRPRELYSIEQRRLRDAAKEETGGQDDEAREPEQGERERPRRRRGEGRDGARSGRRERTESPAQEGQDAEAEAPRRRRRRRRSEDAPTEEALGAERGDSERGDSERSESERGDSQRGDSEDRGREPRRKRTRRPEPRDAGSEDVEEERPRRRRRRGRPEGDSASDRPQRDRSEAEPERARRSESAPAAADAPRSGFGVGLDADAGSSSEAEERPRRRRRRGRRAGSDSDAKEEPRRPKEDGGRQDGPPRSEPASRSGGFGSGI